MTRTLRFIACLVLAASAAPALAAGAAEPAAPLAPQALARQLDEGTPPVLLDVRTPEEFAAGHVPGAINIPVQSLPERLGEVPAGDLVVYCESGRRAERASELLHKAGYRKVRLLDGSMRAWREAQLPVQSH